MPDWTETDALLLAGKVAVHLDEAINGTTAQWELLKVENAPEKEGRTCPKCGTSLDKVSGIKFSQDGEVDQVQCVECLTWTLTR